MIKDKVNSDERAIIFDSGTLISMSMAGLFPEFEKLKGVFKGHFLITHKVKEELIDKPLMIKRFELEALRAKDLLERGILELPDFYGIDQKTIVDKTNEIMDITNSAFFGHNKDLKIVQSGEASCLALSKMLSEKGVKNVVAIDERTTRMIIEKPENLQGLLEKKMHTRIKVERRNFDYFKNFKVIRSTELIYIAYKKGLTKLKDGNSVLDALLYALKFSGCAISSDEIEQIKRMK